MTRARVVAACCSDSAASTPPGPAPPPQTAAYGTDDVTVNDATASPISFPGNGTWTTTQSAPVTVGLQAGTNTIEFSNPTDWAASIAAVSVPDLPTGQLYMADTAGTLGRRQRSRHPDLRQHHGEVGRRGQGSAG